MGRVINISSVVTLRPEPGLSSYLASKQGLIGLTKAYALEVGQFGITSNCILPGVTKSNMFETAMETISKARGNPKKNLLSF